MIQRGIRLAGRLRWLSRYLDNPVLAPWFLFIRRFQPESRFAANYNGRHFALRGADLSALREVLHEEEYQFLSATLRNIEKPVVLDIGAHIGLFALWALQQNAQADVLSVEASPQTFPILSENVGKAGYAHWRAVHAAAWKNNDAIAFKAAHDSLSNRVAVDGGEQVTGMTLAQMLAARDDRKIDILKIDIEGAEEAFLCDGEGVDAALDHVDMMVIELHNKYCDTARVRACLEAHFPVIHSIGGRSSSKVLLWCLKQS